MYNENIAYQLRNETSFLLFLFVVVLRLARLKTMREGMGSNPTPQKKISINFCNNSGGRISYVNTVIWNPRIRE